MEQDLPNGYLIDRSSNDGVTWESLYRASRPNDLGTARTYTDSNAVTPGKEYTYRVFPVFIQSGPNTIGLPAEIIASSQEANLPGHVRNLKVTPDGQTAFDLEWKAPVDDGGHPVRGYLVEVTDDDGNGDPMPPPGNQWMPLSQLTRTMIRSRWLVRARSPTTTSPQLARRQMKYRC